jgi:predicted transcriptional regulator of viral defense system
MKYLGKNYYVALLNAAEIYGAAHQAPQEFFVICNTTNLRNKIKKDVKINFVAKKIIPQKHLTQIMTNSGYINVSSPILTAYDLVCYIKSVGGINRVATVINDLTEKIRFTNVDKEFMQSFSPAATQRLGYLFEELGFEELANKLYRKTEIAGLKFRKTPLVIADKTKDLLKYPVNDRWKLIINEQIDIDE